MITLARFTNVEDANYIKDLLEQNQIECRLDNDDTSEEVDRVGLILLHEKDMEAAQALLDNDVPSQY